MGKLFDKFARMVIEHPDADICDLYNAFIWALTEPEVNFMASHCAMFLKIAFGVRRAPEDIKQVIKNT